MKRRTKLEEAIAGREILGYVNGMYTPRDKRSNLYKAIVKLGYSPDDIGKKIDVVIGAHRRYGTEGWKMAIVTHKKEKIHSYKIDVFDENGTLLESDIKKFTDYNHAEGYALETIKWLGGHHSEITKIN